MTRALYWDEAWDKYWDKAHVKNPNDMQIILDQAPIKRIYANGGKAYELYMRYCYPDCQREIIKLPSTSPANAAFSMERLLTVWSDAIMLKKNSCFL